jgi:hypothetical protein
MVAKACLAFPSGQGRELDPGRLLHRQATAQEIAPTSTWTSALLHYLRSYKIVSLASTNVHGIVIVALRLAEFANSISCKIFHKTSR